MVTIESRSSAKKFGATHTICPGDIAEIKAFINEVTDGRGVDFNGMCGLSRPLMSAKNVIISPGHIANVIGVHGNQLLLL